MGMGYLWLKWVRNLWLKWVGQLWQSELSFFFWRYVQKTLVFIGLQWKYRLLNSLLVVKTH